MLNISSLKKIGSITFHNIRHKQVTLHPGRAVNLEPNEVPPRVLQAMLSTNSNFRVRADSEEAEAAMEKARNLPRKPSGSPIVGGRGDLPQNVPQFVTVRDDFSKHQKKEGEPVFIKEEDKGQVDNSQTPAAPPKPKPVEPVKTAAAILIDQAEDLPFTDFRKQAKALLGDVFPSGSPGRPALVELLRTLPQEEMPPAPAATE